MAIRHSTSNATKFKVVPPFLNNEIEEKGDLKSVLTFEDIIENTHFSKGVTDMVNRPYLTIRNCIFDHEIFLDCFLNSAQISDVRFSNCDLSNVVFSGSALHRVEFISCKLLGTNFSECTLNHVYMHDCNGGYINLAMSKLTQVKLSECDFQHGSFNDIRLQNVRFDTCRLVEADFSHTSLKGIDLRTSNIERWSLNIQDIRGAIVSSSQLMDLFPLLGVTVRDLENE